MRTTMCMALLAPLGCAAIFHGTTDTVSIASASPGRRVLVDGLERGVTPLEVDLESDRPHTVVVEPSKDRGGPTSTTVLNRDFSAGYLVLDLFTGLLGIIVDAATGSWWSLEPEEVYAP